MIKCVYFYYVFIVLKPIAVKVNPFVYNEAFLDFAL